MNAILVTGGAGFIGSNFIHYMLKKYDKYLIINLDKLTYAGNLENLKAVESHPNYRFVKGDICDHRLIGTLFQEYDILKVVNFAAESHVDRSIRNPEIFIRTNVEGTTNLLNIARMFWEERDVEDGAKFLQISTDEVYGSLGEKGYFTEKMCLDPHSPYSASKASADLIVKAFYDTYKMPINITRCSNNYGPYQFPEKLIPLIINNALNQQSIPVYGDGLHVRDWLYVEDHCRAIDLVLHRGVHGEIYNIGGHNERANIDIVRTILRILDQYVKQDITEDLITFVTDRKGHDRRYGIDADKIENALGWQPIVKFEDGIHETIRWYLDHHNWLEHVTDGKYKKYYQEMYGVR